MGEAIPLERVASDARPLIEAFRAAGSISFQDVDLATSRANYVASCTANGPRWDGPIDTEDRPIGGVPCRVYVPRGVSSPSITLLFVHGGGWVIGDLETHDLLCRYLSGAGEARVIAVDYRLAPEHPYPAAHDDALAVARAVLGVPGADEGVPDAGVVFAVGDSAGGNLAAWIAIAASRGAFARPLAGQVLLYPVTDLTFSTPSYRAITSGFPLTAASMAWFADNYAPGADRNDEALSPLRHPADGPQAPAFIATVGLDPLADEGIAYAGRLALASTAVEHHHYPRHAHGLVTSSGRIATGGRLLARVVEWIRETATDAVAETVVSAAADAQAVAATDADPVSVTGR